VSEHIDVMTYAFKPDERRGLYHSVVVRAGKSWTETIGPEGYERDVKRWPHRIQVAVSPTGRSVSVYVNGEKVL